MTPETAAPHPQPAKPVAAPSRLATSKARHTSDDFPVAFHFSISIEMGESLARLSALPAKLVHGREVDIGRRSLHQYLIANDPQYVRAMQNGKSNA